MNKMLIPSSVNPNILKVYQVNLQKCDNILQSSNLEWNESIPKSLQELCLISIANNWAESPILEEIIQPIDRYLLLDLLDVNLPLKLTVSKIGDDVYWRRCYLTKWPKKIPFDVLEVQTSPEIVRISTSRKSSLNESSRRSSQVESRKNSIDDSHKRTWKQCFLEMYIKEYLEKLNPDNYEAEMIKELSDLCGEHVKILTIEELQCSENTGLRIPLNPILMAFQNLKELTLCFKQKYVGTNFSWNVVRTNDEEIKLLARGLDNCRLNKLRIINSDINCNKLETLLIPLRKHIGLKILDFSHCKIGDRGTLELTKFLLDNPIKQLILNNNKIGFLGVQTLCHGISQKNCKLSQLDLSLNQITNRGANLIALSLAVNKVNVKTLNISGCGFTKIPRLIEMIKTNKILQILDMSNNNIGQEMGLTILDALNYNKTLKKMDVRMCQISSNTELDIKEKIRENVKSKGSILTFKLDDSIRDEFLAEMKEVEEYFT